MTADKLLGTYYLAQLSALNRFALEHPLRYRRGRSGRKEAGLQDDSPAS